MNEFPDIYKNGRILKYHLYDEKNKYQVHCGVRTFDPLFTLDFEKVTCDNCRTKVNQPRYTPLTAADKKMVDCWKLPEPNPNDVTEAAKRGDKITNKMKNTPVEEILENALPNSGRWR